MHLNSTSAFLMAGIALGLATSAAQAAPGAGLQAVGATAEPAVDRVDYKLCRWRGDELICRWYRKHKGDIGSRKPESFKTGTDNWFRAMDRDGRGGRS